MRLKEMDKHGVEMMILSLNAPAVQAIPDVKRAIAVAREANDMLADERAQAARPLRRFRRAADAGPGSRRRRADALRQGARLRRRAGQRLLADRLARQRRSITTLPQYRPFWRAVEALDVPFYLHPRNPLPSWSKQYEGHNWLLGPNWAFHAETAVHALRLIGSGLFDECPKLKIVLGHIGEGIPVYLWRIDGRNGWMKAPHKYAAKNGVGHYFRKHFYLTTSGNFSTPALINAVAEMGAERVMFSVDWPFEAVDEGAQWFDQAEIGDDARRKIGRDNAVKLFKLKL